MSDDSNQNWTVFPLLPCITPVPVEQTMVNYTYTQSLLLKISLKIVKDSLAAIIVQAERIMHVCATDCHFITF
jgi:hypothetical protein